MLDLALYSSIRDYIYARISFFTEQVLSQNLTLALTIVLSLLTLWVMIQGYLIATGRSQEGLKGFVYSLGKSYFIVALALGVAAGSSFGLTTLTDTLSDGISQIMTGDSEVGSQCLTQDTQSIIGCKIDTDLAATQTMMGVLNNIDTADDEHLENKLTEARWFAGIGTAGPAIVAGTMLIMFRIAMALFIGFAPVFILCLLFKKTAPLFQKWLYYGLSTIFSGVMLGVMADISMDLVGNITLPSAASSIAATVLLGEGSSGIMQTVTQQLGLGLMLSTLLITVPPMAGMFFNGVMGNFSPYSVFDRAGAVPPSVDGGRSYQQQVEDRVSEIRPNFSNQTNTVNSPATNGQQWTITGMHNPAISQETIKTQSQIGLAGQPRVSGNILIPESQESNKTKENKNKGELS